MSTFNILYEAMIAGETVSPEGGFCQYHLRRDGQITLHVLLVDPDKRRRGIGRHILQIIRGRHPEASSIVAKCPEDLPGHHFYPAIGFQRTATETAKSGRVVHTWTLTIWQPSDSRDLDNHWSHER